MNCIFEKLAIALYDILTGRMFMDNPPQMYEDKDE